MILRSEKSIRESTDRLLVFVELQKLIISGNDGKRKSHIDDGERTEATTNDGDG